MKVINYKLLRLTIVAIFILSFFCSVEAHGLDTKSKENRIQQEKSIDENKDMFLTTIIFDHYYDVSENRTYAKIAVFWEWKVKPRFFYEDYITISWSEKMYGNAHIDDNIMFVRYADSYTNQFVDRIDCSGNITITNPIMNAIAKIPMGNPSSSNSNNWAKAGNLFIQVSKSGRVNELAISTKYQHSSVDVDSGLVELRAPLTVSFDYVEITKRVP